MMFVEGSSEMLLEPRDSLVRESICLRRIEAVSFAGACDIYGLLYAHTTI